MQYETSQATICYVNTRAHQKLLLLIIFCPNSICRCVFTTSNGNVTTEAICKIKDRAVKIKHLHEQTKRQRPQWGCKTRYVLTVPEIAPAEKLSRNVGWLLWRCCMNLTLKYSYINQYIAAIKWRPHHWTASQSIHFLALDKTIFADFVFFSANLDQNYFEHW